MNEQADIERLDKLTSRIIRKLNNRNASRFEFFGVGSRLVVRAADAMSEYDGLPPEVLATFRQQFKQAVNDYLDALVPLHNAKVEAEKGLQAPQHG